MKLLRLLLGFGILCFIQIACNLILQLFHFAFPAPIMGIIVLTFLLHFEIIKKAWVKDICELFLNFMPLLFVPLTVGIIAYYGVIEENLLPILVNVVVTATLVMVLSALFVENVIKWIRLRRLRRENRD